MPGKKGAKALKSAIVFPERIFQELKSHLLQDGKEQLAFILCGVSRSDSKIKFLCKELIKASQEDLKYNSLFRASANKVFWKSILEKCRRSGLSVIGCHSHPFSREDVQFSSIDDSNDLRNFSYASEKIPDIYCGSMVFGRKDFKARIFSKEDESLVAADEVVIIGNTIQKISKSVKELGEREIFDRQILLFGEQGQKKISCTKAAIIGAGGIGSIVFEMLTRLGTGKIILVDDDKLETSNLNRLIGSAKKDVGLPKVEVLKEHAKHFSQTEVETLSKSVLELSVLEMLKNADVLVSCTDSQSSRLVLNELAVKYLIPLIDLGTGVFTEKGVIEAGGQVRIVLPDSFCLSCIDGINYAKAGQELMGKDDIEMRTRAGYVQGMDMPSPSVVSLNGTVASLGVTEFINLVCGIRKANTFVYHDMQSGNIVAETLTADRDDSCLVCGNNGMKALGDLKPFEDLLDDELPKNIPSITTSQ
jgi:molybdopterin/thiamine biosynthesis adenylyltransferase